MPKSVTINQALDWATATLKSSHIPRPRREAILLLQFILNSSQNPILLPPSTTISPAQYTSFQKAIIRRFQHEPLAYITGRVTFFNLPLQLNKYSLIPRPETEELVEIILDDLENTDVSKLNVAEIGTGSGAISIALAHNLPDLKIAATDISPEALSVAKLNIDRYDLESQISLTQGNLLEPFSSQSLDIIIANLPYIPSHWLKKLDLDIITYEPKIALDGGPEGLSVINELLIQAKDKLHPRGSIYLEVWHEHGQSLIQLIKHVFHLGKVEIIKDISGLDRFAVIKFS